MAGNLRARGLFISKFQAYWNPQPWQDYVIIKCTDGVGIDPLYATFYDTAREAGVLVGATHYLRSAIDWRVQADFFLEHSQEADFLSIDFEGIGNLRSVEFAKAAGYATLKAKEESGKRVLFYSSPKYIMEWMFQLGVYWVRGWDDLWIAQWPFTYWVESLSSVPDMASGWSPWLPAGCTVWAAWQYGAEYLSRGAIEGVGSTHVCLEVFNGDIIEMREWAGCQQPGEPVEPELMTWDAALDRLKGRLDELKTV